MRDRLPDCSVFRGKPNGRPGMRTGRIAANTEGWNWPEAMTADICNAGSTAGFRKRWLSQPRKSRTDTTVAVIRTSLVQGRGDGGA